MELTRCALYKVSYDDGCLGRINAEIIIHEDPTDQSGLYLHSNDALVKKMPIN